MSGYDSRPETYQHIDRVRDLLLVVVRELLTRLNQHDRSKLLPPEVETFDKYTPLLAELTYGTADYQASLDAMRPALEHHYRMNRHHPEHFEDGILGMNLVDLIEMVCDWKAASERMKKPRASLEGGEMKAQKPASIAEGISGFNKERFGYDDQVERLLLNTLALLEAAS